MWHFLLHYSKSIHRLKLVSIAVDYCFVVGGMNLFVLVETCVISNVSKISLGTVYSWHVSCWLPINISVELAVFTATSHPSLGVTCSWIMLLICKISGLSTEPYQNCLSQILTTSNRTSALICCLHVWFTVTEYNRRCLLCFHSK